MAELTTSPGLIDRIRHTPMRDVLRGRLTGRLDIKQHIAQSGLPKPASELIQRVIRRTRLRSLEKRDVANELIAHFADGLESGKTIDRLIESFGDERQAARLIARAKRRNRSILGRAPTIIGRAAVSIAVIYTLIGLYVFNGKPSGGVAIERFREYAQQFPEDQRAWPFYPARNLLFDRLRLRTNAYDLWRRCAAAAEDQLGHRDGILVGIALEQYRRAHNTYPTSLDQLVPSFLNEIPASRITGEPVRYRLVKGKPIVYSVGHADWVAANNIDADGNWVLYPRAGDE